MGSLATSRRIPYSDVRETRLGEEPLQAAGCADSPHPTKAGWSTKPALLTHCHPLVRGPVIPSLGGRSVQQLHGNVVAGRLVIRLNWVSGITSTHQVRTQPGVTCGLQPQDSALLGPFA